MTILEAFRAWQETRDLVVANLTPENIRVRVRTWDRYCALRDGYTVEHYAYRRERYGNPRITDASMKFLEATWAKQGKKDA